MKKRLLFSIATATIAGAILYAASDRIVITDSEGKVTNLFTDDITAITFGRSDATAKGYDIMKVAGPDGVREIDLIRAASVTYHQGLEDPVVTMTVKPHHRSLSMYVENGDGRYFRTYAIPASRLKGIPEREWSDYIYKFEKANLEAIAAAWDRPLSSYKDEEVFSTGSGQEDWWPQDQIESMDMPGRDYIAYVYEGHIGSESLEFVREPYFVPVRAKEIKYEEVKFDLSFDLRSNRVTVMGDAPDGCDLPFLVDFYRADNIEGAGTSIEEALAQNAATTVAMAMIEVYNGGKSWDEVTPVGHCEKTWNLLRPGDRYYAVAMGCEYGERTTTVSYKEVTIPMPEVTDDCTFDISAEQLSPTEMAVTVKPSEETTRWFALLQDTDDTTPVVDFVTRQVYLYTYNNTVKWADDPLIHSGEATLNTHDDIIGNLYMRADADYNMIVFGIDETGERTTEIFTKPIRTTAEDKQVTFEITFGEYDTSAQAKNLPYRIVPSDPDAKYVVSSMTDDGYFETLSDEDFIHDYMAMDGRYLTLKQGTTESYFSFYQYGGSYDKKYLFVFGYDGKGTSPVYLYKFNVGTGDLEKVDRGN